MQLQARLVHAEPGRRVVAVSAHGDGQLLGTALGEAATAEEAEDRALTRLLTRLEGRAGAAPADARPQALRLPSLPAAPAAPTANAPTGAHSSPNTSPIPATAEPQEPAPDPEDWSGELAQIDLQLRRLGWQREQESTYLERAFGHPSRSRLTQYADLLAYLQALQSLEPGSEPATAPVPLRRRDLLSQCDALLVQLQWDAGQGRQLLERRFQVSSRQHLSDAQLLEFNMLLEGELIGA